MKNIIIASHLEAPRQQQSFYLWLDGNIPIEEGTRLLVQSTSSCEALVQAWGNSRHCRVTTYLPEPKKEYSEADAMKEFKLYADGVFLIAGEKLSEADIKTLAMFSDNKIPSATLSLPKLKEKPSDPPEEDPTQTEMFNEQAQEAEATEQHGTQLQLELESD